MVTKNIKFPQKNHNTSARILDRSQNFAQNWGFWVSAIKQESFRILLDPPLLSW